MKLVLSTPVRTPIGKFGGVLSSLSAADLGTAAATAALERSGLEPGQIDEVVMGHVIQAGAGQITSRQAAVAAGIPMTVPSTTVNKVCLSGLTAIAMVDRSIRLGEASFAVAGGMESMSGAPYLLRGVRGGLRMGDGKLVDSMIHDGLWDAYEDYHMGNTGEVVAERHAISREEQDEYAYESHQKAIVAIDAGKFADEIVGDGVVVATPFGSTAYYRTITRGSFTEGLGLAFNNSTEHVDHVVLPASAEIRVRITRGPSELYADNQPDGVALDVDDEVLIRSSAERAVILSPAEDSPAD